MTGPASRALAGSGILDDVSLLEKAADESRSTSNPLTAYFLHNSARSISKWHHYFDIYNMLLGKYRRAENIRVLEIGVWKGGSLKNVAEKTFVRIGDQADPDFLEKPGSEFGQFDIVIDDGGHTTNQQVTSFKHLYPLLSPSGTYLVEDMHTNYWDGFRDRSDDITFLDVARDLTHYLYDPYQDATGGKQFHATNPERPMSAEVSRFYSEMQCIMFFDSIVAFLKDERSLPRTEVRRSAQLVFLNERGSEWILFS